MLKLDHINKTYKVDENLEVVALKDINLDFENTGFVCILGQSGCGKTTLLNILGGLDKYTSGDLIINNQSTKEYKDSDWDNYRNKEIGIVFQAYNLIPHLTVLENVSLAMTLSGVSKKEREERAKAALISVGLEKEIKKRPNQMSGGQMQRVALARALVNSPNIILADEPTGALDSNTSIQVMDILKEISKTKLVITVTHNEELASMYASRIIRLKDGEILSDEKNIAGNEEFSLDKTLLDNISNEEKSLEKENVQDANKGKKKKHTSMSIFTALGISGKNLLTKKGKTIITSIAASFGIIGVGLVLALSNGFTSYVNRMEAETLNKFPLSIEKYSLEESENKTEKLPLYPSDQNMYVVEPSSTNHHINKITEEYVTYLEDIDKDKAKVRYNYSVGMNVISSYKKKDESEWTYKHITTSQTSFVESMTSSMTGNASGWSELSADKKTILDTYDVIYQKEGTSYPEDETLNSKDNKMDQKEFGLVLVLGRRNSLTTTLMEQMGLDPTSNMTYSFSDLVNNVEYKYILPDDYYQDEKTIETKTGLFFKDDVTYQQLYSALTSFLTDSSQVLNLSNYFNLPTQDVLAAALLNQASDPVFTDLSNYIDILTLIQDISSGKLDLNNLTNKDVKKYLKGDLLTDVNERKNFIHLLNQAIDLILNDDNMASYTKKEIKTYLEPSSNQAYKDLYNNSNNRTLKITTILRPKENTDLPILSSGIYYPKTLTYQALTDFGDSKIGKEFKNHILLEKNDKIEDTGLKILNKILDEKEEKKLSDMNLTEGITATNLGINLTSYKVTRKSNEASSLVLEKYDSVTKYLTDRLYLGSDVNNSSIKFNGTIDPKNYAQFISTITIYATDFSSKGYILDYLEKYNEGKEDKDKIHHMDVGSLATDTVGQIVSVISAVLISFASISLVVSSIMIAILIYTSVIERTKEIGVLRSIGARKKDVGRLFKAEAMIIGLLSGSIGVIFTYLISLPISAILNANFKDAHLGQIAFLNPLHALLLIVLSTFLTYLASLIPSRIASKKDPVTCLRSE